MGLFDKFKKILSPDATVEQTISLDEPLEPSSLQSLLWQNQPNSQDALSTVPVLSPLTRHSIQPIATQIKQLSYFSSLGNQLLTLLDTPQVTPQQIQQCLAQSQPQITTYEARIAPYLHLEKLEKLLLEMSHLPPITSDLNHDSLMQSGLLTTFDKITKYYSVLDQLFQQYATAQSNETLITLAPLVSQNTPVVQSFVANYNTFKAQEDRLRQEIESFAKALQKIHAQSTITIDWNGSKASFEQKHAELTTRRNQYITQEQEINKQITQLVETLQPIQATFQQVIAQYLHNIAQAKQAVEGKELFDQITTYQRLEQQIKTIFLETVTL